MRRLLKRGIDLGFSLGLLCAVFFGVRAVVPTLLGGDEDFAVVLLFGALAMVHTTQLTIGPTMRHRWFYLLDKIAIAFAWTGMMVVLEALFDAVFDGLDSFNRRETVVIGISLLVMTAYGFFMNRITRHAYPSDESHMEAARHQAHDNVQKLMAELEAKKGPDQPN